MGSLFDQNIFRSLTTEITHFRSKTFIKPIITIRTLGKVEFRKTSNNISVSGSLQLQRYRSINWHRETVALCCNASLLCSFGRRRIWIGNKQTDQLKAQRINSFVQEFYSYSDWMHPGDHLRLRLTWRKLLYISKIRRKYDCIRPLMERLRTVLYRKPGPWFTIVSIPYRKRLDYNNFQYSVFYCNSLVSVAFLAYFMRILSRFRFLF